MTDTGMQAASGRAASRVLPRLARVLAVCAHPDDESFGLGAVLAALARTGTSSSVLCFTHGGASTLGPGGGDLRRVRARELATHGDQAWESSSPPWP
jgi:N-acetylglucosamine malate deacetylase 2